MRLTATALVALLLACAHAEPAPEQAPGTAPAPEAAPSGAPWARSPIEDWSKVPQPGPEPSWTPPAPVRSTLGNGLELVVVSRRELPLVSMVLLVRGAGSASDPAGKAGLAAFTADLVDEGTGKLGPLELAAELEGLGATLTTSVDRDAAFISLSTLSRTLEPSLELLSQMVRRPRFDPGDVERVHGDRMTDLALRGDRPQELAEVVLRGALFGRSGAYGHPIAGELDTFRTLGRPEVLSFHQAFWRPDRMSLVVAGDVDPEVLRAQLEQRLGAFRPKKARRPPPQTAAAPPELPSRLLMVERAGAAQSDVRAGLVGLRRDDPRYHTFEVLNTVLGGGFTSRLNQRLREQLGYTYGAGSSMDWSLEPGPFVVASSLFTPATVEGVGEILRIVASLPQELLPPEELEKAKQNLVRALPMQFETNAGVVGSFVDLVAHGLPLDWHATYQERIRAVSAQDVQQVAAEVIPAERLVFVVVGDVPVVRAGLEERLGRALLHGRSGEPLEVKVADPAP